VTVQRKHGRYTTRPGVPSVLMVGIYALAVWPRAFGTRYKNKKILNYEVAGR
jgi:hypothetical protein